MDWGSYDINLVSGDRKEYLHCPSSAVLNYRLETIRAMLYVATGVEFEWPALPDESQEGEDRAVTSIYDFESGRVTATETQIYDGHIETGEDDEDAD
jgi:hypothetical protein